MLGRKYDDYREQMNIQHAVLYVVVVFDFQSSSGNVEGNGVVDDCGDSVWSSP